MKEAAALLRVCTVTVYARWSSAETSRFPIGVLRAMQAAEPTPPGWGALAARRAEMEPGPLGLSFGERQSEAVAALREALLRVLPAEQHVALEDWLRELTT